MLRHWDGSSVNEGTLDLEAVESAVYVDVVESYGDIQKTSGETSLSASKARYITGFSPR